MSRTYIPLIVRQQVQERAGYRCEYCLVRDRSVLLPHTVDHIIAEQHGGKTILDNLAQACLHCNRQKGPNIASLDPTTGLLVPLFNPRLHHWEEYFQLNDAIIDPLTPIGRATVTLLKLNDRDRIRIRQALIAAGHYP
jgi:hypothetical protein